MPSGKYVCTRCGSDDVAPTKGVTLMDPRYTTGFCNSCSDPNPPKPRKSVRPTEMLVLEEHFDRDAFGQKKERDKLMALIGRFKDPKNSVSMSDQELIFLIEKYDIYQPLGWGPSENLRDQYKNAKAAYEKAAVKVTPKKRARGA